jgi:hypothetical protein
MSRETEPRDVTGTDETTPTEAARAVGLEVSRGRYLRTLDRVRRCARATRVAALAGPVGPYVPGADRQSVVVASADAREVLGKLWTAGERYRRMADALGGDADAVDPGAGRDETAFADLRLRLAAAPDRAQVGEYEAVAAALREARAAIRALMTAREADCETLATAAPDRLRAAAEEAARAMDADHEARRSRERAEAGTTEAEGHEEREDGVEADDGPATAVEEGATAGGRDDEAVEETTDDPPVEEAEAEAGAEAETGAANDVIGASFEIDVEAEDVPVEEAEAAGADGAPDDEARADEDEDGTEGGFEFGVVAEGDDEER